MGGVQAMKSIFILIITSVFLSIGGQGFAAQQTNGNLIYVNASDNKGPFDGKSWSTAFKDLQDAIKTSSAGDQIWVAKGTYYPTESDDRDIFFSLKEGVKLYGGFKGNEKDIEQRDWIKNITTLSANIGDKKTNLDNSYHVAVGAENAVLDGFVVRDGYSLYAPTFSFPGKDADDKGTAAEIHITPQHVYKGMDRGTGAGILLYQAATDISNCTFENNIAGKGGAMYIMLSKNEPVRKLYEGPTISDCKFIGNYAYRRGGAISVDLSTAPTLVRCEFINNKCEEKGGAVYNDFGAQTNLTHCLFVGNVALSGSAMGNDGGYRGSIDHCTFVNNVATEVGPALYQGTGGSNNPTITNSIIWGNTCENDPTSVFNFRFSSALISYSCVEGGYPGEGNIDKNPKFVDHENDDFRLSDMSPCIDSGLGNASVSYGIDLDGNPRVFDDKKRPNQLFSSTDMGVYERQTDSRVKPVDVIYVSTARGTGLSDGTSWPNAMNSFQDAMDTAYAAGAEVWVAKGVYTPTDTLQREMPFYLREGVEVYGGFKGTEIERDKRNPLVYKTVLSGDIGIRGYAEDNSYHVLIAANGALLDGVTIADGNANAVGTAHHDQGAGLLISRSMADASAGAGFGGGAETGRGEGAAAGRGEGAAAGRGAGAGRGGGRGLSLTLRNCIFTNNNAIHGGAVYCQDMSNGKFFDCVFTGNTADTAGAVYDVIAVASTYENCSFIGNHAEYKGGAMYFDYGARPTIKGSAFVYNTAGAQGGAIATISRASQVENTIVKIDDTVFSNNQTGNQGGAIYNYDASFITLTDCQIVNNKAVNGAGAVATVFASETTLNNCIVKGNTSVNGNDDFLEEIRSKNIINN